MTRDNPVGLSPTYFTVELDWDPDTSRADAERDSWQLAVDTMFKKVEKIFQLRNQMAHPGRDRAPQKRRVRT